MTHDQHVAKALPRALAISHGVIASEGRGERQFAVINRDGTIKLPAEVAAYYPAGDPVPRVGRGQRRPPPSEDSGEPLEDGT